MWPIVKIEPKLLGFFWGSFWFRFYIGSSHQFAKQHISLGAFFVRWNCSGGSLITIFFPPETLKQKKLITQYFDLGLEFNHRYFLFQAGNSSTYQLLYWYYIHHFYPCLQPYFINVLGQNSQSLTLMFIMFGVLGFAHANTRNFDFNT